MWGQVIRAIVGVVTSNIHNANAHSSQSRHYEYPEVGDNTNFGGQHKSAAKSIHILRQEFKEIRTARHFSCCHQQLHNANAQSVLSLRVYRSW